MTAFHFSHQLYLRTLPANAPLRYLVEAFCLNCDAPILPPAANRGIAFCLECRAAPEYRLLVGG